MKRWWNSELIFVDTMWISTLHKSDIISSFFKHPELLVRNDANYDANNINKNLEIANTRF